MRRRHTATILGALALAAERGQPLSGAVSVLAADYPNRAVRWRLRRALKDIDAGNDWAGSLARRRRWLAYRMQSWGQVLFALVILSFGAVALVFVVSFFPP